MKSIFRYLSAPSTCHYLPDQTARLEYDRVASLSADEYAALLSKGWRRFGRNLFRPRCPSCSACLSMRVDAARFRPDRSQRRAWRANADRVRLEIGEPSASEAKLRLYDRYHHYQAAVRGWAQHDPADVLGYRDAFVENPFPTEEWTYWLGNELVGVGYVDPLPVGPSAIYFFHDPAQRDRSLGTYNILCLLAEAVRRGQPHVYLGFYVGGCQSLSYKARFRPNEVLAQDGTWKPYQV